MLLLVCLGHLRGLFLAVVLLVVAMQVGMGACVLHGDILGLACGVAGHYVLLPHASCIVWLGVKSHSIGLCLLIFCVGKVRMIKVLLIHISRVRLLERPGDCSILRRVPGRLRSDKGLLVSFTCRVGVSIVVSKVHLLETI